MNPWLGLGAGSEFERARVERTLAAAVSKARPSIAVQQVVRVPAPTAAKQVKAKPARRRNRWTHAKAFIQLGIPLALIPYCIGKGLLGILALMNDGAQWSSKELVAAGTKKGSTTYAFRTLIQAGALELVPNEERRAGVPARMALYRITPPWRGTPEHQETLALAHNDQAFEKREALCA